MNRSTAELLWRANVLVSEFFTTETRRHKITDGQFKVEITE